MIEKRWAAIAPQNLTVDGTTTGTITVADAGLFKVKQVIKLASNAEDTISVVIQRIPNATQIEVGPLASRIYERLDVSAYLVADSATIEADEQPRTTIGVDDTIRATYEEEPTVAQRIVQVNKNGDIIDPVTATTISNVVTLNSAVDVQWDELEVTSINAAGDPLEIVYKLATVTQRTLTFTYDGSGNLTNLVKS